MGAPLPAGTVIYPPLPDSERLDTAKHYLNQMIFGVETRPKGFDYYGVTWLVENFLRFVSKFRGPGDIPTMQAMWVRRHKLPAVPFGRKRSQHLVFLIKTFKSLLDIPGEKPMKLIYDTYEEMTDTMFDLVEEFRAKMEAMNHVDLEKFKRELERVSDYHRAARWY
ncbi:MAG: hypothetical protein U0167_19565 [bacterium]